MKKALLGFILISALSGGAYAQSILKIYDVNNFEVTNMVLPVYQDTSTLFSNTFSVKNTSGNNITAKARKEEIQMAAGCASCSMPMAATSSICFAGTCYGSNTYTTPLPCKAINAASSVSLVCDFNFGNSFNPSSVRYTVYNCNGTDSASFIIQYNASPAGILNHVFNASISEAYPNPASTSLNFNYKVSNNVSSRITIHNLLGNLVKTMDLTEASGNVKMDVSDLDAGIYFYTLEVNNRSTVVRKFIVRR